MSDADNRHPQQPHPEQGWQPLPQGGEYEQEATAFVQLPEGFTTGAYGAGLPNGYGTSGADPLAAPGHGYTPPASFTPPVPGAGTDPSATGQWTMPFAGPQTGYADPSAAYQDRTASAHPSAHQDHSAGYPGAPEAAQPWGGDHVDWPVAGSAEAAGAGGTWSVPTADEGPEESGEYLVGDDGLTGHPGHQGHPGHSVHQGHEGHRADQGHQGYPGYPGYSDEAANSLYGGAPDAGHDTRTGEAGGAGGTGHWNFAAGLAATSGGTATEGAGAGRDGMDGGTGGAGAHYAEAPFPGARDAAHDVLPDATHGGARRDPYAAPVADPYGAHPNGAHAPAEGATGHWSLPADAMAQWPPAADAANVADHPGRAGQADHADRTDETDQADRPDHSHDPHDARNPHEAHDPQGMGEANRWSVPAADGERPDESGQFATGVSAGPGEAAGAEAAGAGIAAEAEPARPAERADAGEQHGADTTAPVDTAPVHATEPEAAPHPATAPGDAAQDVQGPSDAHDEHPAASYVLRVNGTDRPVTDAWIGESLLYVLRERLGLAGAKDGCSQGECGACSVQVDGRLVASCLVPAATAAGSEVRTVEGLAQNGTPSDVQRALAASGAVQCGFCVPGMAMTVHDLLEGNHAPSELETRKALCGNLCRCSGYRGVLDAVDEVVKARAEAADAAYAPADTRDDAPADTARIPRQAGPADPMDHAAHDQDSPGRYPHDPGSHDPGSHGPHHQGPGADPQSGGSA
ncbi:2Fe-2S iron-sulfur cluster-binding protein [Streptomyces sp. NPDC093589]|uniref:2Fe-2S iron-sulfur cluster-binding protein n=1 Tax=Streptomyces sp. NPDC093589 TaxID=3366043 RepID=UPI003805E5A1